MVLIGQRDMRTDNTEKQKSPGKEVFLCFCLSPLLCRIMGIGTSAWFPQHCKQTSLNPLCRFVIYSELSAAPPRPFVY